MITASVFGHLNTATSKKGLSTGNKTGSTNQTGGAGLAVNDPGAPGKKTPVKK